MPRVLKEDDLAVFGNYGLPARDERVFTRELAEFLNFAERGIKAFCRLRAVLHKATIYDPFRRYVYWITPHTAANVIAYFRALQEEKSKGMCWHKRAAVSRSRIKPKAKGPSKQALGGKAYRGKEPNAPSAPPPACERGTTSAPRLERRAYRTHG